MSWIKTALETLIQQNARIIVLLEELVRER